jgi:hypothetical protein
MALCQLALTIYLTAETAPRASAGTAGIAILVAIATLELAVMIAFSRIGRSHDPGDDDQDDDGPGWGREGPRTPPPDAPPVSWPEFEREFAEYVAALETRRDVRPERKVASAQARKQAAPADVFQLAAARSSIEPSDGTT